MKKNNFILGGGISGLIYAFYNRDHVIISPDAGGRLNHSFFQNIIYFHATKETERFLNDIGVEYSRHTQLIKYAKNNQILNDISKDDKVQVIRKKLQKPDFTPYDLKLSTSDNFIQVFKFSFSEVIEKLTNHVNFIQDKVVRITNDQIITENTQYYYDNIVSTLPANVFWNLYYEDSGLEFISRPTTFVLSDTEPEFCKDERYDMIYFIDDNQEYVRISKRPGERENDNVLYEFPGDLTKDPIINLLPEGAEILEHYVDKNAVIETNHYNIPPKDIIFVGRFAQWEHSYKQQDVIKEALFGYDLRHIFNRQKRFSKFHISYDKLEDMYYKNELTKDYILHILGELSELLNECNYKHHTDDKEIDVHALKVEIIDIFKYLLNVMLIWGMDAQEFAEVFNEKSDEVEEKFRRKNK